MLLARGAAAREVFVAWYKCPDLNVLKGDGRQWCLVPAVLAAGLSNSSLYRTSVQLVSRLGEVTLGRTAGACDCVLLEVRALGVLPLR